MGAGGMPRIYFPTKRRIAGSIRYGNRLPTAAVDNAALRLRAANDLSRQTRDSRREIICPSGVVFAVVL